MSTTKTPEKPARKSGGRDAFAGAIAGFTSVLLTYPIDLIKVRLQSGRHGSSVIETTKNVYHSGGLLSLWTGCSVNFFGSTLAWGGYFGLFHHLKNYTKEYYFENTIAAWLSGFCIISLTQPIWTVKSNLQLQEAGESARAVKKIKEIFKLRGFTGFYRGFIPNQLGNIQASVQLALYQHFKERLVAKKDRPMTAFETALLSMTTKTFSILCFYPYQVVKTQLQDIKQENLNLRQTIRTIHAREGVHGFYKGLIAGVLKVVPSTVITFVTYEKVLQWGLTEKLWY